jgi:phosphate/sulfate permease
MCSQKSLISICTSLLLSTLIGLLIATSLFSFLFSPLISSATSRSRSWTPYSTLVDKSCPSEDPWADVDYFYFFLSSSCKMGGKVTKPKTIPVTETSGFKEEDHSWSIVNIHLACAVNTVLSLCPVIFVICVIVYVIQRLVRRYCKKKREAKERQRGISMLPFHNQTFGTKSFDQRD